MKKSLPIVLAVLVFSGCFKETIDKTKRIHGLNWSGTYAVPAANIDVGLSDALAINNDLLRLGSLNDNVVYLAYEKTVKTNTGEQMILLANQSFANYDALTSGEKSTLTGSGSVKVDRQFTGTYTHSEEIDSILYLNGNLAVNITNPYSHAASVAITFPDLIKNGQPVVLNGNVSANSSTNLTLALNGCKLKLTSGGLGYNHFRYNASLTYTNSGNGFTGSEQFGITVGLNIQRFNRIWGYFGNNVLIDETDSVQLTLFGDSKQIKTSNILFADPKLKFYFTNTTGIPFKVNSKNVTANKAGSATPVTGFPEDHSVAASTGSVVLDSTEKNEGNSNFKTLINTQPKHIAFAVTATSNPNGKVQRNYLDYNSVFSVKVWVELPFNGWVGKIEVSDTSELTLDLGGADDYIEWITLRVETHNGLPLEVEFQGYFADSSGKILDSIFIPKRPFALAAVVDANGNVLQESHDVLNISFDKSRIKNLKNASQLIFNASLLTARFNSNLVPVRLTSEQRFKLKLGVHSKISAHEKF